MKKYIKFEILGKLPDYNTQIKNERVMIKGKGKTRNNKDIYFSLGNQLKQQTENYIVQEIKRQKINNDIVKQCYIEFTWIDKSRRDPDNIVFAKKYILDAMQKAKIIVNDNKKCVLGFYDKLIKPNKDEKERIIVTINIYE